MEAENDCTRQTRLFIDQISMQQGRIVALEGLPPFLCSLLYVFVTSFASNNVGWGHHAEELLFRSYSMFVCLLVCGLKYTH